MAHTRSQQPICTGTSVIGLCYDGGIAIAADNLVSFGKMARFRDCSRIYKVNEQAIAGCAGDYADFQYIQNLIEQKQVDKEVYQESNLSARALHSWLTRVQYNRRSKFDPLWNTWVVGGIDEGKPFLGYVDHLGTAYKDKVVCTGYGAHLVTPQLRKFLEQKNGKISKDEAISEMKRCISLLFLRDCTAHNTFEIGVVNADGAEILGPFNVKADWKSVAITRES